MRLFIAVNFCERVKSQILELQNRLRVQSLRGNFTRPDNLHLTLAFLGETPEEKTEEICRIISDIRNAPFEICFNKSGCFTRSHKELWWIGADPNSTGFPLLVSINRQLIERLLDAGISVDSRPFNAHITLAREVKHTTPIILNCPKITVNVDRISLMKSEHIQGGMVYTEIFGNELKP